MALQKLHDFIKELNDDTTIILNTDGLYDVVTVKWIKDNLSDKYRVHTSQKSGNDYIVVVRK